MKVVKRSASSERAVLTGMIVDSSVVARIAPKWTKEGLFSSPWANVVGKWCVDYSNKYNRAPRKHVEGLFAAWAQDKADADKVKLVEKFLTDLSGSYAKLKKESNPDYTVDLAGKLFDKVQAERLRDAIDGNLSMNKVDEVYKLLQSFGRIEVGGGAGIDLFTDEVEFKDTFNHPREALIKYPGDVGKFFGMAFERDSFVSFMAPGKRGKSFWLIDVAFRAMLQRRRVAFFQVGDLSKNQIKTRFTSRVAGRPLHATRDDRPVRYPKSIVIGEGGTPEVEFEVRKYPTKLSEIDAWKAAQQVMQEKVKSKSSYFKLSVHPAGTLSMSAMKAAIDAWDRNGWLPEIVVIDYADILAPPAGYSGAESRESVNANWKAMRALSQQLHGCVVTATQGNAASYKVEQLDTSNFSEDNRKFTHVTACYGINQTAEEKRDQVQRLNCLVLREDEFVITDQVYCAGCLAIANPVVRSTF